MRGGTWAAGPLNSHVHGSCGVASVETGSLQRSLVGGLCWSRGASSTDWCLVRGRWGHGRREDAMAWRQRSGWCVHNPDHWSPEPPEPRLRTSAAVSHPGKVTLRLDAQLPPLDQGFPAEPPGGWTCPTTWTELCPTRQPLVMHVRRVLETWPMWPKTECSQSHLFLMCLNVSNHT